MICGSGGRHRAFWELAFSGSSAVAALAQGITLGALLQGITVKGRSYGGGWWDWLTPFSLLAGVSLVIGYGLLGACWLVMRTKGDPAGSGAALCAPSRNQPGGLHRARQRCDALP